MKLLRFFPLFFLTVSVVTAQQTDFISIVEAMKKKTTEEVLTATLLQNGADANARDEQGRTALMLAATYNPHPSVISTLIKGGANVNARTPDSGQTALFFAVRHNSAPEIITALLDNGANPDILDVFSKKAADYATFNPKLAKSKILSLFAAHTSEAPSSDKDASR